ncbi:hypothetical protein H0H93_000979 [Arthromyces matolae]|nr:hypothetical protein H0H93_000979 [Arthromyces matolae]
MCRAGEIETFLAHIEKFWPPPPSVPSGWSCNWTDWERLLSYYWLSPYYLKLTQIEMHVNLQYGIPGSTRPILFSNERDMFVFNIVRSNTYYLFHGATSVLYRFNKDVFNENSLIELMKKGDDAVVSKLEELEECKEGLAAIQRIRQRDATVIPLLADQFLHYTPLLTTPSMEGTPLELSRDKDQESEAESKEEEDDTANLEQYMRELSNDIQELEQNLQALSQEYPDMQPGEQGKEEKELSPEHFAQQLMILLTMMKMRADIIIKQMEAFPVEDQYKTVFQLLVETAKSHRAAIDEPDRTILDGLRLARYLQTTIEHNFSVIQSDPETALEFLGNQLGFRGRPKFDKSKHCVRCKTKPGNIVIRHAFRRALDPTVNPLPDGPRRKGLKAGGDLLIGYSGGLGSGVLLDLVYRTYFSFDDAPIDPATGKPRGGKDHPRNLLVWPRGIICYVETCNAFSGAIDRTEDIRAAVQQYEGLVFLPLRIEDAFSLNWWENNIGGKPHEKDLGIDITNEVLLISSVSNLKDVSTPVERLKKYISSLPTQTAIPSAVRTLTRMLLLHTASAMGCSHLLLGTSLTSLSISLISSISQGGGFVVREEAREDWTPQQSAVSRKENGHENGTIRIVRPLQDIGMKECAMWAWWHNLNILGSDKFPNGKQSIGRLTRGESLYPIASGFI